MAWWADLLSIPTKKIDRLLCQSVITTLAEAEIKRKAVCLRSRKSAKG